jgi:hypothetical protein
MNAHQVRVLKLHCVKMGAISTLVFVLVDLAVRTVLWMLMSVPCQNLCARTAVTVREPKKAGFCAAARLGGPVRDVPLWRAPHQ